MLAREIIGDIVLITSLRDYITAHATVANQYLSSISLVDTSCVVAIVQDSRKNVILTEKDDFSPP